MATRHPEDIKGNATQAAEAGKALQKEIYHSQNERKRIRAGRAHTEKRQTFLKLFES